MYFIRTIWCALIVIMFLMQVLDRGEKIELLVDKTENLHSQVCNFICSLFTMVIEKRLKRVMSFIIGTNIECGRESSDVYVTADVFDLTAPNYHLASPILQSAMTC